MLSTVRARPVRVVLYILFLSSHLLLGLCVIQLLSENSGVNFNLGGDPEQSREGFERQSRETIDERGKEAPSRKPVLMNRVPTLSGDAYQPVPRTKASQNRFWIDSVLRIGRSEREQDLADYKVGILRKRQFEPGDVKVGPLYININESDILVNLHIQKTGGSFFETLIAPRIVSKPPCDCEMGEKAGMIQKYRCKCLNSKGLLWNWSRFTVSWEKSCGVHPDFTTLSECLPGWYEDWESDTPRERKFHYTTILREPVQRFLSEWMNVRRGALWGALPQCDHRQATQGEIPSCVAGSNWKNVTLQEFISCRSNQGINRMTRMLANMSLSDCYRRDSKLSQEERDEIMLASAKYNLAKRITFFGFLEDMLESAKLFDYTFRGLSIASSLTEDEINVEENHAGNLTSSGVPQEQYKAIIRLNQLDIRLYQFAKDLFLQRLEASKIRKSIAANYYGSTVDRGSGSLRVNVF